MFPLKQSGGTGLPPNGKKGQVLAKQSDSDGDVVWQDSAGIQGTWGGEFSTLADLKAYTTPTVGFNYVVTADEDHGSSRTYYTYAQGGVWQYLGSYSDGMATGGVSFAKQWTSPASVVTGQKKALSRSYDSAVTAKSPEVWAFESGTTNQISVLCEFDNGSASSFSFDSDVVEFVGTGAGSGSQMRLKTTYVAQFVKDLSWNQSGQYSECSIDMSKLNVVESVVIS